MFKGFPLAAQLGRIGDGIGKDTICDFETFKFFFKGSYQKSVSYLRTLGSIQSYETAPHYERRLRYCPEFHL
jgi:hypothetical protein